MTEKEEKLWDLFTSDINMGYNLWRDWCISCQDFGEICDEGTRLSFMLKNHLGYWGE